jgi:uncharacterized Zn-binding protein involved in type VI secretion
MSTLESLGGKLGEAIGSRMVDKPPEPDPDPDEPKPPPNPKQELADQIKSGTEGLETLAQVSSVVADPGGALKDFAKSQAMKQMDKFIPGFSDTVNEVAEYATPAGLELVAAKLTNNLAAALGPFPAATLTSLALGVPHAHVKHPPSGPPPLPPIPLPPLGPVMLGTCIQVLINSKPAARCGDFGLNPTCCGVLPPLSAMYEIMTGSSNVYIGGTRAARSGIDITMHCKPGGGAGKAASAAAKMTKLQKVAAVAAKVASVASKAAAVGQVASDYAQAEADDNAAMASAIALNAAMTAAQMAADAIAMALSKQMGTDQPMIPPTGTPGMILNGAATVMIGGLPLPSFAKVADALSNRLKGLRGRRGGGRGGGGGGPPPCHPSTT